MVKVWAYKGKWREIIAMDYERTGSGSHAYEWEYWFTVVDDDGNKVKLCVGWCEPKKADVSKVGTPCVSFDEYYTKIETL